MTPPIIETKPHELTLALMKPDALEAGVVHEAKERIEWAGLAILAVKRLQLTAEMVMAFYAEHQGKPFFEELVAFMTSGLVVVFLLNGPGAIGRWRELLGATDPRKAAPDTLRGKYGNKDGLVYRNIAHGSDSPASAVREIGLFFSAEDLVELLGMEDLAWALAGIVVTFVNTRTGAKVDLRLGPKGDFLYAGTVEGARGVVDGLKAMAFMGGAAMPPIVEKYVAGQRVGVGLIEQFTIGWSKWDAAMSEVEGNFKITLRPFEYPRVEPIL
jgi:nucleoside-diphosphate kinase